MRLFRDYLYTEARVCSIRYRKRECIFTLDFGWVPYLDHSARSPEHSALQAASHQRKIPRPRADKCDKKRLAYRLADKSVHMHVVKGITLNFDTEDSQLQESL
jgi:hypothetical protein